MSSENYTPNDEPENETQTEYTPRKKRSGAGKGPSSGKKGFYIALSICLAAVAVAGWTTYGSLHKYQRTAMDTLESITESIAPQSESGFAAASSSQAEVLQSSLSEKKPVSSASSKAESKAAAAAAAKPQNSHATAVAKLRSPAAGAAVQAAFSETPVYSKTMHDWRAHAGVDLRAEKGTAVTAAADGTVIAVSKAENFGTTVQLSHTGGLVTWYCGLSDVTLQKGDTVKTGQTLGKVGEVPCEADEASHLHFAVQKAGAFIDPAPFLK